MSDSEIDANEDKLYGTELFEELPMNERREKFEEQVRKNFEKIKKKIINKKNV